MVWQMQHRHGMDLSLQSASTAADKDEQHVPFITLPPQSTTLQSLMKNTNTRHLYLFDKALLVTDSSSGKGGAASKVLSLLLCMWCVTRHRASYMFSA